MRNSKTGLVIRYRSSNEMESFIQDGLNVKINNGHFKADVVKSKLYKRNKNEYTDEHAPDIVIQAGPQGSQIKVHKEILKENIPYFKAMFSDHFQEASQSTVHLGDDADFQVVSKLINFVYKGSVTVEAADIQSVFQLTDQWGLTIIKNLCATFMIRELDAANYLDALHLAEMHSCEELLKYCQSMIAQEFQAVTFTHSFLQLPAISLSNILQLEQINTGPRGEEFILDAVMRWYYHDPVQRQQCIGEVLHHVKVSHIVKEAKEKYLANPVAELPQDAVKRLTNLYHEAERPYKQHFLVICGYLQSRTGPSCPRTDTVERFDPDSSNFVPVSSLSILPSYGVAFNLMGKVVFVAGCIHIDQATSKRVEKGSVWTYNVLLNKWKEMPELFSQTAIDHIIKCLVNGGTVVHCAHQNAIYAVLVDESMHIDVQCNDGELFCDKKAMLPSLLTHLEESHTAMGAIAHKGQLYVMGGYYGPEMERVFSNIVLVLSQDKSHWKPMASMQIPRAFFSLATNGNCIFVAGGYGGLEQRRRQQSCEYYCVETNCWHFLPQLKQSRSHHCTVVVNNKIYTIGGKSYASQKLTGMGGWHFGGARIVSDFVELLDPLQIRSGNAEWNRLTRMTKSRCNFTTVVI